MLLFIILELILLLLQNKTQTLHCDCNDSTILAKGTKELERIKGGRASWAVVQFDAVSASTTRFKRNDLVYS